MQAMSISYEKGYKAECFSSSNTVTFFWFLMVDKNNYIGY